jgi:membrane protein YdbS with pleckstrin-like domain
MIPAYIFAITGFVCLGLQKYVSIVLMIISAVFSAIIEYLWITHYSFSVVVILLFLYHVIVLVTLFAENIPGKLKMKRTAEKTERDIGAGKI